ncbi:uncharacterized protein [Aristolochia californica]|uniref:uncharacterized protein n=1 Tax=Aristolochia californica TaxID=171875 RepID=UPI0035DB41B8
MGPHAHAPNSVPRYLKLDFLTFDGSTDPLIWLYRCDQLFYNQRTPADDQVQLAANHMLDEALLWFHQFKNEHLVQDWDLFKQSCMLRFGPPTRSNPLERLARASNFVRPSEYVHLFTADLTEALRLEVELYDPRDLDHAMNLARTIDAKQRVLKESLVRRPSWPSRAPTNGPSSYSGTTRPGPNSAPRADISTSTPPAPYIKKLSRQEMEQRRAKGLCYNCDEQYVQGHLCKRLFCLEVFNDPEEVQPVEDSVETEQDAPAISLHAITGMHISNTMQNTGISVSVAKGAKISSAGISTTTPFSIEGYSFVSDFFVIPLARFDLVLRIKWLQMLGPILWDFKSLTMMFIAAQRQITLHGTHATVPCTLQEIQVQSAEHCKLTALLTEFGDLFQSPTAFPPIRHCDHHIRLKLGTEPVVVRPYHYPLLQKDKIERQCQTMLAQGVIQPSRSSFSSPVLLVTKHDRSWRFCVDYRELNAHTIKDKFPIPVVDELFDELHGATLFTKLDLKSGDHQIQVHPSDVEKTAFRTYHGHFEFLIMPFGLSNAPSSFQAVMVSDHEPCNPTGRRLCDQHRFSTSVL